MMGGGTPLWSSSHSFNCAQCDGVKQNINLHFPRTRNRAFPLQRPQPLVPSLNPKQQLPRAAAAGASGPGAAGLDHEICIGPPRDGACDVYVHLRPLPEQRACRVEAVRESGLQKNICGLLARLAGAAVARCGLHRSRGAHRQACSAHMCRLGSG